MASECILLKGGGGVDLDVITAGARDVLLNKVIVDKDGNPLTGTMPNNGAVTPSALNCGGSYTIPEGYHDGTGKVTANSLASQTDGTATAAQILKDQTAYVDGVKVTGTMANNGAVAPSALGAGGSYTIPAGYHNGSGIVTVQSLATLTASGDATAAQILSGKKAYVDGSLITGSMADQGAKTSSLNCGGSYTIPAGYHNGSGKITANSLASQTDATATAAYIKSGYTAWVKGSKLTGTMAVTSAINFKATALSTTSIRISWTNPSTGPWEGVFIQMSTSGNPGVSGGTRAYTGTGVNTTAGGSNYVNITGLTPGVTYYFTCTSYCNALGWGTSHNVSAKTNGLLLYNYGVNAYALSIENSTMAAFQTDHILCTPTDRYEQLKVPSINYQNYTKLKVIANIYVSSSWFDIFCVTIHNANKNVILHSLEEIKFVQETTSELAFDISSISTETLSYLNFHVHAETSSYDHDYNSKIKIYKLWLE